VGFNAYAVKPREKVGLKENREPLKNFLSTQ